MRVDLVNKLRQFWRRNERRIVVWSGVILLALAVIAQFVPGLTDVLVARGVLAGFTLLVVVEIASAVDEFRENRRVHVSRDQHEDATWLTQHMRDMTIGSADLIECSSQHAVPLLIELKNRHVRIRLLVKHPDDYDERSPQREQIRVSIRNLFEVHFTEKAAELIEVRCYRRSPSLRGRKLGEALVNVGWYTPDVTGSKLEIRGHSNPLVTSPLHSLEGQHLKRMFDEVFDGLWNAPETVDARPLYESWSAHSPGGNVTTLEPKVDRG